MSFTLAHALAFSRDPGEDRLALLERNGALVVVVADGAGGLSGGARAAVQRNKLDAAACEPIQLVRLPSGGLQDDVGVVLVRRLVTERSPILIVAQRARRFGTRHDAATDGSGSRGRADTARDGVV